MSKKAQKRAARRARLTRHLNRQPEPAPRVFPRVREPFYLPELLGFTPSCWQGDVPTNQGGPVIRTNRP